MRIVLSFFILISGAALAHDWWIRPSEFRPSCGQLVHVLAFVGHELEGEAFVRKPDHLASFTLTDPAGVSSDVLGQDGKAPVGFIRPGVPGIHLLGYLSRPRRLELEAEKFRAYLEEEGLHPIVLDRERRGETAVAATESYVRCAKSLMVVGDGPEGDATRRLGFPVEIVPESNPMAKDAPDDLTFLVLCDGKPLAEAHVVGVVRDAKLGALRMEAKSDAEGRVKLSFKGRGPCLVKAVHMRRAAADAATQWESWWATLTFAR